MSNASCFALCAGALNAQLNEGLLTELAEKGMTVTTLTDGRWNLFRNAAASL